MFDESRYRLDFERQQLPAEGFISIDRKADKPKPESEDAQFADREHGVYVVADGVSRYAYDQERSPAARAAREAVAALGNTLVGISENTEDISRDDFMAAFMHANEAVARVNETETFQTDTGETRTLKESTDLMEHDLAGTVAVAAVTRGDRVAFGFIGDCRLARIAEDGSMIWQALTEETDKVAQAQKSFGALRATLPPKEDPNHAEARRGYINDVHRHYRNNPYASHPTYGVLTGQPEATDGIYLVTGGTSIKPGERLVLYSDGMEPFMNQPEFRALLSHASNQEVDAYIDTHKDIDDANDDKTLLVIPG